MATDYSALYAKNGVTPLTPGLQPGQLGYFRTATGQQVYGVFDPLGGAVRTYDPKTGQATGQFIDQTGQAKSDNFVGGHSAGDILKHAALLYGGTLAAGAGLGALGGSGAAGAVGGADAAADAGGTVTMDLPVAGVAETVDPATGLVTSSLPSAATSAAASGGGFAWKQFLPSAITSGVHTIVGSLAARSAANQQKQAGQAAAQSFSPFAQGGLDAYNQMLAKYGIRPVSAPPGSIGQRPGMPPGAPMSPSPISQPIPTIAPPGAPMAAQPSPYTLASFGVDPTATPTASSFGGR